MRIAFIIVCMATIGWCVVSMHAREQVLRNRMLTLQAYCEHEIPLQLAQAQKDLAYVTAPTAVQERVAMMKLPMVDKHEQNTGLARIPAENRDNPRHPRPTPPREMDGRPDFGHD